MKLVLIIGTGSFLGGSFRYLLSQFVQGRFLSSYPYGTFTVNIIGCFIIGLVFAVSGKYNLSPEWRLFLATGICGGFTTFSSFSFETMAMIREGQYLYSFLYIGSSIFLGLIAVYLGMTLFKLI